MKALLTVLRALFVLAAFGVALGGAVWWRNHRTLGVTRQTWVVSRRTHQGPISRPIGRTLSTYYFTPQEQQVFQQTSPRSAHPQRPSPDKKLHGAAVAMDAPPTTSDGNTPEAPDRNVDTTSQVDIDTGGSASPEAGARPETSAYEQTDPGSDVEGRRNP